MHLIVHEWSVWTSHFAGIQNRSRLGTQRMMVDREMTLTIYMKAAPYVSLEQLDSPSALLSFVRLASWRLTALPV